MQNNMLYLFGSCFCFCAIPFLSAAEPSTQPHPIHNSTESTPYEPDPWEDEGEIASGSMVNSSAKSGSNGGNNDQGHENPAEPDPWEDDGD